jgi:cell wall-associated NlpC family hydrolase
MHCFTASYTASFNASNAQLHHATTAQAVSCLRAFLVAVVIVLASSLVSTPSHAQSSALEERANVTQSAHDDAIADLLFRAVGMIGTNYKRGGNAPETGFDCSGFVRYLFGNLVSSDLPRTSSEFSRLGEEVARIDLKPGDLVFFNTLRRAFSHVGIYMGDGRFVHAPSKGKRVEIVDMNERYWQRRFNGARRLLVPQEATGAENKNAASE